ncbi:hypothetical protein BP5796_05811 [Coleophoma crateriformis]|uniref:Uncharacterized protein n=1 Tax=Coleophoma crateriformis TaxID=565419 RepID=A0A3D8RV60_9HELO|nr:hypothetical protein BP5796_05811 [Coleophoma crateriformis]
MEPEYGVIWAGKEIELGSAKNVVSTAVKTSVDVGARHVALGLSDGFGLLHKITLHATRVSHGPVGWHLSSEDEFEWEGPQMDSMAVKRTGSDASTAITVGKNGCASNNDLGKIQILDTVIAHACIGIIENEVPRARTAS